MSILLNDPCSRCKNSMKKNDKCPMGRCKAFPNGIPGKHWLNKDVTKLDECANGFKYEYDESKDDWKDVD